MRILLAATELPVSIDPNQITVLLETPAAGMGISEVLSMLSFLVLAVSAILIYLQVRLTRIQTLQISPGEKLVNSHQFILAIETDLESLEARDQFYRIHRTMTRPEGRAEILRIFEAAKKKGSEVPIEDVPAHKVDAELYQKLIRHLNVLEVMANGVQSGAMDEIHLLAHKRNGHIDDICVAQDGIQYLRKIVENPRLFELASWLAWRWMPESKKVVERLEIDENFKDIAPTDKVGFDRRHPGRRSINVWFADQIDPNRESRIR